jgi:hypothetical protein
MHKLGIYKCKVRLSIEWKGGRKEVAGDRKSEAEIQQN